MPNYQTLIIKAWGYFVDAEQEATLQMFWDISWEEIKAHFKEAAAICRLLF